MCSTKLANAKKGVKMNSINNYPVGNVSPNFCAGKVKSKKVTFPGKGKPVLDNSKLNTSLVRPLTKVLDNGEKGEYVGTVFCSGKKVRLYNTGKPTLYMETSSLYQ